MQTSTRTQTVVGLFDDMSDAQRAVTQLESTGISGSDINIVAGNESGRYDNYTGGTDAGSVAKGAAGGAGAGAAIGGGLGLVAGLTALAIPGFGPIIAAGPIAAALTGGAIGAAAGGMIGGLRKAGVPEHHANMYAEGVRRGHVLVTVSTTEDLADRAADILDSAGARDVEEKSREWGSPSGDSMLGLHDTSTPSTNMRLDDTSHRRTLHGDEEQRLPVVEEELHVGKREIRRGGVRVFSEVHERPVEEQVTLREEHVRVERVPVDRPIDASEMGAFREGTIELTETAEEAVVDKRARVVEEVLVSKDVNNRTETIRDTVRSTDVQVEQTSGSDYDDDFRTHFQSNYARGGGDYDRHRPAYQFGHQYASDARYRDRDWSHVENDLRRDWDTRGQGAWEDVKDSIRYGWDKVRGRR